MILGKAYGECFAGVRGPAGRTSALCAELGVVRTEEKCGLELVLAARSLAGRVSSEAHEVGLVGLCDQVAQSAWYGSTLSACSMQNACSVGGFQELRRSERLCLLVDVGDAQEINQGPIVVAEASVDSLQDRAWTPCGGLEDVHPRGVCGRG